MKYLIALLILFSVFSCKEKVSAFEKIERENESKIKSLKEKILYTTKYEDQINIYKEIIGIDNGNGSAYSNLGLIYYELEDYEKAVYFSSMAIDIYEAENNYFLGQTFTNRAKAKFELNDYQGCINDLNRALKLGESYQSLYAYLGYSYLNLGDLTNACKNFSLAGEKGYSQAYQLIAQYCN
jgi:tetratricopeptide (TPR) repeat protein